MTLDYEEIVKLVRIRQQQIGQSALEVDRLNIEYMLLEKMETVLAHLIVNARKENEKLNEF